MTLQPCYDFLKANESILLAQTKASLTIKGTVVEVDAEVHLELLPRARIEVQGALPESIGFINLDSIENLTIAGRNVPGFLVRAPFSCPGGAKFVWCLKTEPTIALGTATTKVASVLFHIFNYKDLRGTRCSSEQTATGLHRIEHVDFKAAGWHVVLKSLPTTSDIFSTLNETGGYGLTHVGCLQKEDVSSFDGKTAEKMLTALRFFLSFSEGMWCNPCLAVGFDDKEDKVWEAWSSPQGHWDSPISWFDAHHCDELANLFPGFMAKCESENWKKALHEVIYWYLSSNCSTLGLGIGIDAGIILSQAAIERLSFEYAVRHKRLIEAEGFKNLRASDKFRLLFSSLNIPIDIPASFPELHKLSKQFNWLDAPHAITEIRNSLVHPERKQRGQFGEALFSAWNLGQWYLELALLRICDYSGTYSNRLILNKYAGTVETVPWDNNKGK